MSALSREPILILLFDMHTGVAGDMILGALFDLGLDFHAWKARMEGLGLPPLRMGVEKVSKHGIGASRFVMDGAPPQPHRGYPDIRNLIDGSRLSEGSKQKAQAVFLRLADVEAGIHSMPLENVHFHELGAVDAIVDIVGACLGFEMLEVTGFYTTPFTFGSGTVQTAHGRLSVPAPATLALSRGFPSRRTGLPGELCTPTGAAIVTTLARPIPSDWVGTVTRVGYGAGARDLPDTANVLRLCLMEPSGPQNGNPGYELYQLECNLDNMAPEIIGYAVERLFAAGCKDVWQEPILMKKNRSAVKLCALAEPGRLEEALTVLASETYTGGMRYFPVRRLVAEKGADSVETRFGTVALKRVEFPGRAEARFTPEFESCRGLALETGIPLHEIYREALAQASLRKSPGA